MLCCAVSAAFAQTGEAAQPSEAAPMPSALVSAFAGDWFSFDPASSLGGATCAVSLQTAIGSGEATAEATGCAAPLDTVTAWRIEDGQIRLAASAGDVVSLGGTQFRISGAFADGDRTLILERAAGGGDTAAIREAVGEYRCLFFGFTSECAEEEDLRQPVFDANGQARIETVVNLNARSQPRGDAAVSGVIPTGSTVVVDECLTATDGLWCRANFGDQDAWFRRTALREETWPILTFRAAPPA